MLQEKIKAFFKTGYMQSVAASCSISSKVIALSFVNLLFNTIIFKLHKLKILKLDDNKEYDILILFDEEKEKPAPKASAELNDNE
mgnify:CR=1 FL=1